MFIFEEYCCIILANELEQIALPDSTTQSLGPMTRDVLTALEDLWLLGKGDRPQFL
jgi:hypothetical protein